jgi:HK97 family phage major capsid protein/HK97 family phage prohead protease
MSAKRFIKTGEQSKDDPFTFVMSTEDTDRDGDIVVQSGIDLRDFRKNPVALYAHNHTQPIGIWQNVRIEGKRLLGELKLAALGTSEFIDTLHKLVEQRILRAVSIGFIADPDGYERNGDSGIKFGKTRLLECSLVAVPANQNALRVKALTMVPADLRETFCPDTEAGRVKRAKSSAASDTPSARTGLATAKMSDRTGSKPMSLAKQITAKQERLIAIKDRLTEIEALAAAGEELDDDLTEEIDTLEEEQAATIKSLEALQKVERGLANRAQPAATLPAVIQRGATVPATVATQEKPGALLVKTISAAVMAKILDRSVHEVMGEMYANDDRLPAVAKMMIGTKSAVAIADTTTPGWAAELVRNDMRGFLQELAPVSVYAALLRYGVSLDFGSANSITIPRRDRTAQNNGAQIGGAFVGEAGVIPVKALAISSRTLNRYKLAVISTFTEELAQQSVPGIEDIIRAAILEDTALVVDNALLDNSAAVAGVRPAGLLNGVTLTASSGDTSADIVTDIRVLLDAMASINGAKPVLIMNTSRVIGLSTVTSAAGDFLFRDEVAQGRLLGVPIIASPTVAPDEVIIIDAGSFVGANASPRFTVSDQATLTMANADGTAPTQADDGTGALGTQEQVPPDAGINIAGAGAAGAAAAGYTAMSLYQQYAIGVRMILPTSWGLIRTGAVAGLSGVSW